MPITRTGRRPNGSGELPARSFRVSDEVWELAKQRAALDGATVSQVLAELTEGYARGAITRPRIEVVYAAPDKP